MLVRKRPTPGTPIAKSASLCSANSLTCRGVMICSASDFNSSGLSGAVSSESSSPFTRIDRKSTRLNSSHSQISYAVFCLKKKKKREKSSHNQISSAVLCLINQNSGHVNCGGTTYTMLRTSHSARWCDDLSISRADAPHG